MSIEKENLANFIISNIPKKGLIALGAGSTVNALIDVLGEIESELMIISAASSTSLKLAENNLYEVPISHLYNTSIELLIDGADRIINSNTIIKGYGGAPTAEKILWQVADRKIVAVDTSKLVIEDKLKIPVEIIPMALPIARKLISEKLKNELKGYKIRLLKPMDMPFITDLGNYIIDITISSSSSLAKIHESIKTITGVVDTGIFTGSVLNNTSIFVGYKDHVDLYKSP